MLTGCDVERPESVEAALLAISRFNDGVQALLFDPNKLAPTYPASMILRPPKFNAYYDVMDVKPVNGATWRLELSGLIAEKRPWTLPQIAGAAADLDGHQAHLRRRLELYRRLDGRAAARLPRTRRRRPARQICRLQDGRRLSEQHRHGDGTASADIAGAQIRRTTRSPIRSDIRCACEWRPSLDTKIPKWITAIEVTNTYPGGYWEAKGFPWFAGI